MVLVGLLLCTAAGCVLAADIIPKHTAAVFSFAYVGMDAGTATGIESLTAVNKELVRQHADDLHTLVTDGMAGSKYISSVKFEPRLTAVQRAVKEQKFTDKEVLARLDTTPAGAAKAQKMAAWVGAEIAMIGSIDKYVYNPQKGDVELTATIQMIDVRTGKVVEMFTATGRGARGGDGSEVDEAAIGTAATYDAAEKLLGNIMKVNPEQGISAGDGGFAPVASSAPTPQKKSKGLLPAMLGAALIGFLISGG